MKRLLSLVLLAVVLCAPARPTLPVARLRTARPAAHTELPRPCRRAGPNAAAKELARTAQITAETIATDHRGSYQSLSPPELRRYERPIPISRRQARRSHDSAYIAAAWGSTDSDRIVAEALNGNSFEIALEPSGELVRTARICGVERTW